MSQELYDQVHNLYLHKPMAWQEFGRLVQDLGGRCGRQHNGTWQFQLPHRENAQQWAKRTMHNPIHNTGESIDFSNQMHRDTTINLLLCAGYMLEALSVAPAKA